MTHGGLLSLTILNVVVDTLVRHWVLLVAEVEEGPEGWGREVLSCSVFFYADKALIASTKPE